MEQYSLVKSILEKYYNEIQTSYGFELGDSISDKKIKNIEKKFAPGITKESVVGFYDTTVTGSGKNGYLFTDTKIYYLEMLNKPQKIWYDDIECVELMASDKKDCDSTLIIHLYDETIIEWSSCFLNKTPLLNFFTEIIDIFKTRQVEYQSEMLFENSIDSGAIAGGIAYAAKGQVNKLYEEEKFHAKQGHGFAAEKANDLYDRLTGHDAKIVGDDNAKNGADRIVDGLYIQSKYCRSGKACIDECFNNDGFRYTIDGKPMQIEVPSDKWDAAVEAMQERIKNGEVLGITDPNEAKNIVRKGHFTYEQAKNIAKAGTIDSLKYDAVNGTIIAASAFGVTAVITLATNLWNGENLEKSIKVATYSGLKVGGTAFITSILASQLSRAGLNSALVGSSEAVVAMMGPKASAVLVNAFRSGGNIYGAAAAKSAAKLLRGNAITAGITVVVLSSFDIANIFRGRISGKQLFKNMINTTTTVVGGTGGWLGGAAVGSAILPGVGTVVGGLIGSVAAGAVAGKATSVVVGNFIEDDAEEMVRILQKEFEKLATDYLLTHKEAEKSVDKLKEKIDGNMLKNMFASKDRSEFARNILVPIIESEVTKRIKIPLISDEQMIIGLKSVLEDIADSDGEEE